MNQDADRTLEVLNKALEKTRKRQLEWASTKDKPSENFYTNVGKSQMQVAGKVNAGPYIFWLLNAKGEVLGQLTTTAPLLARFGGQVPPQWETKVEELWKLARRQALAIDEEFDEVLDALESEENSN